MRNRFKILTTCVLAGILIFGSACSCNGGNKASSNANNASYEAYNPVPEVKYTDIKLADNGRTDYKIVIPENPTVTEVTASNTLKEYFKKSTSADIVIENDTGKAYRSSDKIISVGNTTLKEEAGISVTKEEVNLDGYKLIRRDNTMFIAAYSGNGIVYGVYEFLWYAFGFEPLAADAELLNVNTTAYLPDLELIDKPSFEGRLLDGPLDKNHELQSKMRVKNMGLSDAYGDSCIDEWMEMHCHSFLTIVPYDSEHPEWFSNANQPQWCLTNEELITVVSDRLIAMLEANPQALYVNMSEEDFGSFCSCNRVEESYCGMSCSQSTEKYGVGGTLMRFLNKVITKIEAWRETNCPERDLKYVTFLYHATIASPTVQNADGTFSPIDETVIPHEKLYPRFAPIQRCFTHSFVDQSCSRNKSFALAWEGWKSICDRFTVWEYRTNYSAYLMFFNNYGSLQEDYIASYEAGAVNYMAEYVTGSNLSTMMDLNVYLNSKLLWNVYEDVDYLINHFMDSYYKAGAPYMKEYLSLLRTHLAAYELELKDQQQELHCGMYETDTPEYFKASTWPKQILDRAAELLEQASATYDAIEDANEREIMKTRILKESVCLRYIYFNNASTYYNVYSDSFQAMANQWLIDLETLDVSVISESQSLNDFVSKFMK